MVDGVLKFAAHKPAPASEEPCGTADEPQEQ
jgi:hypothetical protein